MVSRNKISHLKSLKSKKKLLPYNPNVANWHRLILVFYYAHLLLLIAKKMNQKGILYLQIDNQLLTLQTQTLLSTQKSISNLQLFSICQNLKLA